MSESRKKVQVYCILTNWTQKDQVMPAPKGRECVQINENKMNASVYCILTNWTQKDQDRLASADGNCVQFALLGCYNEYIVLYESGRRFSLGMDNYR